MVCFEDAKVIGAVELKSIIEEEYTNPTVERLMFLETKDKENKPGKVFPCYLEAWAYEEEPKVPAVPNLEFQCCITQSSGGQFGLVRVVLHEKDLGVNMRVWNKPPKKAVRDETPWLERGVVQ